jgi:O-antigen/teichoic acid export membrane protein
VAFLTTIAGFTSFLASAGIEEANANFGASEPESRRALASNSLIFALLLGALAAGGVAGLVHAVPAIGGGTPNGLRWLTLGLLPVLILNLYLRWLVRADYAFAITNVALLVTPLGNVVANGILAFLGLLTLTTAVVAWLAGQAISTIILVWYVARRLAGFGLPDLRLMRRTLGFGLKTHAGRVMLLGNFRLDQWILGAISGARELGLYSVAVAWAEALWYLPTALKFVQRPFLVRSGRLDAVRRAAAGFRAATLATIGLGLAMVAVAPFLCVTIFGEKFRGSIVELRILVIGALGVLALTVLGNALVAQRRPILSSISLAAGFVCTLVLDIILIPPYAGVGAAVASAIAYTVAGFAMSIFFVRALEASPSELIPAKRDIAVFAQIARGRMPARAAKPGGESG